MIAWWWVVIAIAIVIIIAGALWSAQQRKRSTDLRRRFGPEYEREVRSHGRREAEAELESRERRVEALDIRPLSREDRESYSGEWRIVQARFVDDPSGAIREADVLVGEVMRARGYPVGDFEQRAADVSVDHPHVVQNYRAAHDIALRQRGGTGNTEELRKAMVHYRALFEDLLGERVRVAGRSEEVQP
jgi:FtsZ-interacting cell division protein ZipA